MSTTWTRAHDALIARVAEGLDEYAGSERYAPHYLTNLTATARAQEAWRNQSPATRTYTIEAPSGENPMFRVNMYANNEPRAWVHGDDPAEFAARAWALWRACGGGTAA